MKHNFKSSDQTLGLELELQLVNMHTQDLSHCAKKIIREIKNSSFKNNIKPEVTQSMIEINSSVHFKPSTLHKELTLICQYLRHVSNKEGVSLCGGGTHPFQNWMDRKIFPSMRFRDISKKYGYLAKKLTVFSMHVHVGCPSPDMAIYLTHMLSRYVPQFIGLSASSPFYNGVNTGFNSTRININDTFPQSGHIPMVRNWSDFCRYFYKMQSINIVKCMKDFYWDVRPKPEFGTVEVRVCDMPLTLDKAIMLAAYIQTISSYLVQEQPFELRHDFYDAYHYNRFQASHFGYDGKFINPFTLETTTIQKDILTTIKVLRPYAKAMGTYPYLYNLRKLAAQKENDASFLKNKFILTKSLVNTVQEKCKAWKYSLVTA